MRLSELQLRHFRNLAEQELVLPSEGVAIVGENAQGKTNLLEAIYYLETFRSFRGTRDDRLVAFGEDVFRIVGVLAGDRSDGVEVTAAFQHSGKQKKVTVDGEEPERLGDALGRLAAVVFTPADVGLVSEGPGTRRRFLDIVLSLNAPGYLPALQSYRQALAQRNAALRNGQGRAMVDVWDQALTGSGAVLLDERRRWIERWMDPFAGYYRRISGDRAARMAFRPGVRLKEAGDREQITQAFQASLHESREREVRLGNTVVGPHRDDLVLTVEEEGGDRDLREFGSGGQRRTAALALRLVEAATIRLARHQEPIVLMDDVFAELDPGRSERILALMEEEETGQVLLTVPKESDVRFRRETLPRWTIAAGKVVT